MTATLPFLTSYDPPGAMEGTLDPLGLYLIADQLAVELVPAVRERMVRVRFLTAMTVGAVIREKVDDAQSRRDASAYLVWEWLVVEAMIREMEEDPGIWGVPGSLVTRRALGRHGYVDARSYLKVPRIFGFHGVYKRLAIYLGLVDVHLNPGPNADRLVDAWARDLSSSGREELLTRWTAALRRSLAETPPRTKPGWSKHHWGELAAAFAPSEAHRWEKRVLRDLLLAADDRRLGALPAIWQLQDELDDGEYGEELLHNRLREHQPGYSPLLEAIRAYEAFARSLQDGFDVLRANAAVLDTQGYRVSDTADDPGFRACVKGLNGRFARALRALEHSRLRRVPLQDQFRERFGRFAEPMDAAATARALCEQHEEVQRGKSAEGKRPWFDKIGPDSIYVRHAYREPRPVINPRRYVHAYRGWPIRRFYRDLR